MAVGSYLQLILPIVLLVCCIIGQAGGNAERQRRQSSYNYNTLNNPNGAISNDQSNQKQLNGNLLASSQGQAPPARSLGFYSSSQFKPPSFSGEKPVGWFDTKYPNWVSNQDGQLGKNNVIDGKNAPPSSLQAKPLQPREDGGLLFLQKVAEQYRTKGEKANNIAELNSERRAGNICTNRQNFNGYKFNKFRCPLPPSTGMNQNDQYCCGPVDYQYCCNKQEFNYDQYDNYNSDNDHYGKHRHPKHGHYPPSRNLALPIILPIACIFVICIAGAIILLYHKQLKKDHAKDAKSSTTNRLNDNYSAVPQDPPVDKSVNNEHEQRATNLQT